MTIKELLINAANILSSPSAALDARVLLMHALGKDEIYLAINRDKMIDKLIRDQYFSFVKKRAEGEPVAYITGYKEFMSLPFKVNKNVLIPRPDTELLAETAINEIKKNDLKTGLDLCSGSGCVAVSICHYTKNFTCTGVDISEAALSVMKENITLHKMADRVFCKKADILSDTFWNSGEKYDIIVSNPPYIRHAEIAALESDVKDHEPHLALDGGQDGLLFYRFILQNAKKMLNKNGVLILEIGYDQADEIASLADKIPHSILKDLSGNDRVALLYYGV